MEILKKPKNLGKEAVLCYADLNYLKLINDTYSHAEGNYSLQTCANTLTQATDENCIVGRIGGDEFAILKLISNPEDGCSLKTKVQKIHKEFSHILCHPERSRRIYKIIGFWTV